MRGFNLSKFKKSSEDLHHAILVHPDGHQIKIAKASLNSKMKGDLANLPMHLADGGEADLPQEDTSVSQPYAVDTRDQAPVIQQATQNQAPQAPADQGVPVQPDQSPQAQPQSTPQNFQIPQAQPSAAMAPGSDQYAQMKSAFDEGSKGNKMSAAADSEASKQMVQATQEHEARNQKLMDDTAKQQQANEMEIKGALQDVKNGHIDPSHYMSSKSSMGKVSTAIGLILGGMGGALTGQENPALKFLNEQINRDIESQRTELGKKENVLSAFQKQTGNINDAMRMTHVFYGDMYADKMKEIAAKSSDPLVNGRYQQAQSKWDMERAQILAPLAQRQAIMKGAQTGGGADIGQVINAYAPEHEKEALFKELQTAQNHSKQSQIIMSSFDRANKENTILGRASHAGATPASVAQMQTALMPYLKDAEGRINESELKRTDDLIPKPGDSAQKIEEKRQGLLNFLEEKAAFPRLNAFARQYGLKVPSNAIPTRR